MKCYVISKQIQHNMYVLIKHTILIMWQHVALMTLAAIRRVLREAYFFRHNYYKDLHREVLQFLGFFFEGTTLFGGVFLSNSRMLTAHCPDPFLSTLHC